MGTLRYMSPEQALGERDGVDQRSDVYSLGVTLYEMLSLTPIYPTTNRHELLQKRQQEEPTPLRQVNPAIPVDLETIVHKAIAREPTDRYTTAQKLADDLRRFLNHEPIQARRATLSRAHHQVDTAESDAGRAGVLGRVPRRRGGGVDRGSGAGSGREPDRHGAHIQRGIRVTVEQGGGISTAAATKHGCTGRMSHCPASCPSRRSFRESNAGN